jgi:hypothetical protein
VPYFASGVYRNLNFRKISTTLLAFERYEKGKRENGENMKEEKKKEIVGKEIQ